MELLSKIQSTKLGALAVGITALVKMDAPPWAIVAVVLGYMFANAIQNIGTKK